MSVFRHSRRAVLVLAVLAILPQQVARADEAPHAPARPLLAPLFSDDAVLQRDKPVTVWGWATPGDEVSVRLSGGGLTAAPVTAKAGADGRWQAALGPCAAGGPYLLTARSGAQVAEAKNVLVGDVWLCGGQSNMEWLVKNSKDYAAERTVAELPRIRHIRIARSPDADPQVRQESISGQWKVCKPDTVGDFTAVGFFFARELHRDLGVPIGLVNNSVGGTEAERWMSPTTLAALPETKKRLADYRQMIAAVAAQKVRTGKDYPALIDEWYRAHDPGTLAQPAWSAREFRDAAWTRVKLPALFKDQGAVPWTYRGTAWVRREFTVPKELLGKRFVLHLGRIHDWDTVWINGRQVGATEDDSWYGIYRAYWIFDEKLLQAGPNTIAMRIVNRGDPCGITRPWDGPLRIEVSGGPSLSLDGPWRFSPGVEFHAAAPLPLKNRGDDQPATLYNTLVAPLAPMTIKGAIWYQGEGNSGRPGEYRVLLPALIGDWRSLFAQGDFPFLIVQLPNWANPPKQPETSGWADIREAQAQAAQSLPHCGLAVTIDVGDPRAIHPTNKQPVGHRLALAAKAIAYGQQIEWSGPWYKGMAVEEPASIRLSFDHLGGGLVASDAAALRGFAIAGRDGVFTWADARIDGDTVVVSSPRVPKPAAVRYGWATNPACNLASKAGLPAVPFRTDDRQ